jgi:anti-sigma factor RsiW
MTEAGSISEADLHAYADGLIDAADRARVEAYLATHAETAEMVADWMAQSDELRAVFSGHAVSKSSDLRLLSDSLQNRPAVASPGRLSLAAAAVVIFALGVAGGHYGPAVFPIWSSEPPIEMMASETLPREAHDAFLVYASEVRHPVEVFAQEETHLAAWLGKRLSIADLKVPDLQRLDFHLVGGRLLPVDGQAGAMLMYEDKTGRRITVLLARNAGNRTTSFRFASTDGVETFYWIDDGLGYAVTGEISRQTLQAIADECYRQFPS